MADSDNTMSLLFVTRRKVLAGTAIAMAATQATSFARIDLEGDDAIDPAVAVWKRWQAAWEEAERLCTQQQRLESVLIETVGFPCTTVTLSDGESVTVHSVEALQELLGVRPVNTVARTQAEAEIVANQARWDAAAREIGYSTALLAEREAGERAKKLLEALSQVPATSLAGIAAKLNAALREGEYSLHDSEPPWPQIRSALDDIARIREQKVSS
ncbi:MULTISPECIES: hypothetical protein [unclassified Mesorhizobium]|uniref:hypothetical protein n=1 Tax=unclassified Mesorhizobium TaxID=325217 RepID=UPI0003CE0DCE|nr:MULTISPECIES: hypothetical protein [unclassified Mesorhizobium]ESX25040.1 hypothetical protein X767_10365 [Mesorhizobium sp. LSJC264A00]ESZ25409.1 hypothetical protein X733_31160 [Mesorhizobium sp. L2C067A000]